MEIISNSGDDYAKMYFLIAPNGDIQKSVPNSGYKTLGNALNKSCDISAIYKNLISHDAYTLGENWKQ